MSSLIRDLASQVHANHVYTRPADLAAYAFDASGASGRRRVPLAVVFPASTEEVAGVVRVCAHHGVPVVARGAGTGYAGGATCDGAVIVSLTRMNRVLNVDAEARQVTVQAGALTATVHDAAQAAGLRYAPDPISSTTSTIGGNIACNAGGPRSLRHGTTGEHVSAVTAVLADGSVVRCGEGAGGDDLLSALTGSEGTLAIITEARLRLIDEPPMRGTLAAGFDDVAGCAAAVTAITEAGVLPAAIEFMDRAALEAVAVTGYARVDTSAGALLIVELEGERDDVEKDAAAVQAALTRGGALHVDAAADAGEAGRLWRLRHAVAAAVAAVTVGNVHVTVAVPRTEIGAIAERARGVAGDHGLAVVTYGHAGEGVINAVFLADPRIEDEYVRAMAAKAAFLDAVLEAEGSLVGPRGSLHADQAQRLLGPATAALLARLEERLDPQGILNPGAKVSRPQPEMQPA